MSGPGMGTMPLVTPFAVAALVKTGPRAVVAAVKIGPKRPLRLGFFQQRVDFLFEKHEVLRDFLNLRGHIAGL